MTVVLLEGAKKARRRRTDIDRSSSPRLGGCHLYVPEQILGISKQTTKAIRISKAVSPK